MDAPAGYADQEPTHAPPWHGLVVWDVFLNALATGIFLTAALCELSTPADFATVTSWSYPFALLFLLLDLVLLVLDLGDPMRFHHMLRVFKPCSPMSLGTWCLTLFVLPLAALVAVNGMAPDESGTVGWVRKLFLIVAIPVAFASMAYKGVLFSTSSQPGWRDARWLGAYHTASAFAFGAAALLVLAKWGGQNAAFVRLQPAAVAFLMGQAIPLGLLSVELWPALRSARSRGHMGAAAVVVFGLGIVLPVSLVLIGGSLAVGLAALTAFAGGWTVRYLFVTLSQIERRTRDHIRGAAHRE